MTPLRPLFRTVALGGALALGVTGCDLVDPTDVSNPALTEEAVLNTPRPVRALVGGLERQTALAFNQFAVTAELVSDNYVNVSSFYSSAADGLSITFQDADVEDTAETFARLRELAGFGLSTALDADPLATDDEVAELHFFKGVANVYLGELFVAFPDSAGMAPAEPAALLQDAVASLNAAIGQTTDADAEIGYRVMLARAYYSLGDRDNARAAAQQVVAADPDYVRYVKFDNVQGPGNTVEDALFDRSLNDLQPLPRLDFLDPKFSSAGGDADGENDIPYIKGEEAYLILIEDAIAGGDLSGAQDLMKDLIDVVDSRPDEEIVETDPRDSRPRDAGVVVRSSPDDPFLPGLVLTRAENATVTVQRISGTSVTDADVDAIGSEDEAIEVLYLMRQEIFLAEGRRMTDLGIRFPIPRAESLANENVSEGPNTTTFVPASIQPFVGQFDSFAQDEDEVTIEVNLNEVISANRTSADVVPFL